MLVAFILNHTSYVLITTSTSSAHNGVHLIKLWLNMFAIYFIFVDTKLCTEEMHSHVYVQSQYNVMCGLYCYILDRIHTKQYFYVI